MGCGNGYGALDLPDDSYTIVNGYVSTEGSEAGVRYSFYHQTFSVSSNEGTALISEKDIGDAANDRLASQGKINASLWSRRGASSPI